MILGNDFKEAAKKEPYLGNVVQTVQSQNSVIANKIPINTIVEDLTDNKKVTLIFDINGNKQRVVAIYDVKTGDSKVLESVKINPNANDISSIVKINEEGKKVAITNDV